MLKAILIFILFMFPASLYAETYFQWIDENGVYHLTNDYEKIPLAYRNRVNRRVIEDVPEVQPPPVSPTPQPIPQKESIRGSEVSNIREEWRGRKDIQSEQPLKQAEENLEAVNKEYLEESDKLIERRYGSHQQFKSTILGMTMLRQERDRCEARLMEAKKTLKRVSDDAESLSVFTAGSLDTVGIESDIYGRDQAWWRQQAFDRGEQLKKAIENYEKAYKAYVEIIDHLGPSRFGGLSLTQYQMISGKLILLKGEMIKYEAQLNGADEGMRRLIKEAEESGADVRWLKE